MDLIRGQVVRSRAGHDRDLYFVVLAVEGDRAVICDGKTRQLEKPKKKNRRHLCLTQMVLSEDHLKTNKQIRTALRQLTDGQSA